MAGPVVKQNPKPCRLVLDKHLARALSAEHMALCPTLDLVAIITSPGVVEVFRFSGHRAFGTKANKDAHIIAQAWRPDGLELAIFWNDGTETFLSSNMTSLTTTKVEGEFLNQEDEVRHTIRPCMWQQKALNVKSKVSLDSHHDHTVPEKWSFSSADPSSGGTDLAALLDRLDLSEELPRLDAVPPLRDQTLWRAIGTQHLSITVDRPSSTSRQEAIDVTLIASGTLSHIGCTVGVAKIGLDLPNKHPSQVNSIASTTCSYCHAILSLGLNSKPGLHFVSLNAIFQNQSHLKLIGSSTRRLQDLSSYITRCIDVMRILWKAGRRALEQQFINVQDTLTEHDPKGPNITTALYQLAMTGHCGNLLKTWLTEEMGSQGITRWYTALGASLQQILAVCQHNLLPALEYATIEAINLRALASRKDLPICQIESKLLIAAIDDLDILRITSSSMLTYVADEAHQTHIFSDWLMQYEAVLNDATSQTAKEAERKIAETDYPQVLDYIVNRLTKNPLNIFLGRSTDQILAAQRRPKQSPNRKFVEMTLKRHEDVHLEPSNPVVELINMLYLALFVRDTSEALVTDHNAKVNAATVTTRQLDLSGTLDNSSIHDLIMVSEQPRSGKGNSTKLATYVLSAGRNTLTIHKFAHRETVLDGDVTEQGYMEKQIRAGSYSIIDAKFMAREIVMLLSSTTGALLASTSYQYDEFGPSREVLSKAEVDKGCMVVFEHKGGFRPKSLIVGKDGRIGVLDETGRNLRVYDMLDCASW